MDDFYAVLKEFEPVRRKRVIERTVKPGDEFKPFAVRLKALKKYGWVLRDAMEVLYQKYLSHVPVAERIDNNALSRKLSSWQAQGLFSEADIKEEVLLLERELGPYVNPLLIVSKSEVPQVSIMSKIDEQESSSEPKLGDFLKYYRELKGSYPNSELTAQLQAHFNKYKDSKTLDGIMLEWKKENGGV
ncbi:hypothetical protein [Paraburkholderia silvatlantica]|uniref:Uncharacterized protein n=1 Tax=Paraburkholderia silvatlantica TaxID=321895 RepID=A0ABR6FYG5_9BURK|nr:hypothetical protein [Paraburkholderia silvatlantica]MBB2932469.1 hypothetical protein [Paraburkholderia silvatlantica]PVY22352.1 hypothetical protein C7411_13256 [Paraburkholderia silvatlantica]PXW27867.1 hypothetical protein C7413_13356 [Paraburkholderia silvatlantica]